MPSAALRAAFAACAVCFCLSSASAEPVPVMGFAYLAHGHPIEGAEISVRRLDGKPLKCSGDPAAVRCHDRTTRFGTFLLLMEDLPERFVVYAKGGTVEGERVYGTLSTVVERHDGTAVIDINPATSIVQFFLKRHPARRVRWIENKVKRMLGLDLWESIGGSVRNTDAHVAMNKLAERVKKRGGWHRWTIDGRKRIERRGAPIDVGEHAVHEGDPPRNWLIDMQFRLLDDAVKACNPAEGRTFGWLAAALTGTETVKGKLVCPTSPELLENARQNIGASQTVLADLEHEMLAGFEELNVRVQQLSGDEAGRSIIAQVANIKKSYDALYFLASYGDQPGSKALAEQLVAQVVQDLPRSSWDSMQALLLGSGEVRGVYRAYWSYLQSAGFVTAKEVAAYNRMIITYSFYCAIFANLLVEEFHVRGVPGHPLLPESLGDILWMQLNAYRGQVSRHFARYLPQFSGYKDNKDTVTYDIASGLMWDRVSLRAHEQLPFAGVLHQAELASAAGWAFPDEYQMASLVNRVSGADAAAGEAPAAWLARKLPATFWPRRTWPELPPYLPLCVHWPKQGESEQERHARACSVTNTLKFVLAQGVNDPEWDPDFWEPEAQLDCDYRGQPSWADDCRILLTYDTGSPFNAGDIRSQAAVRFDDLSGWWDFKREGYCLTRMLFNDNSILPTSRVAGMRPPQQYYRWDNRCGTLWSVFDTKYPTLPWVSEIFDFVVVRPATETEKNLYDG